MNTETDIIEIMKKLRYFKLALRKLLSQDERMLLKERSRYFSVDPSNNDWNTGQETKKFNLINLANVMQ